MNNRKLQDEIKMEYLVKQYLLRRNLMHKIRLLLTRESETNEGCNKKKERAHKL